MKTSSLLLLFSLASLLSACGADTSSRVETPDSPVLDLGADSLGIDMGTDTVRVYWSGQTLVVDADQAFPGDSLQIAYRVTGSLEWLPYSTLPLMNFPLKFNLLHSEANAFTVDFQLTLLLANGERWVADTAYAALTARLLQPSSSGSNGSSSSALSSSSSSAGYAYTVGSGTWGGDFLNTDHSGIYILKLNADASYQEQWIDNAEEGFCVEIHGKWLQNGNQFAMQPAREYRNARLPAGCPNYLGSATIMDSTTIHYQVTFLDAQGKTLYLEIPGSDGMRLFAD